MVNEMRISNKIRLWWIKHGFGNKGKTAQNLVVSLVKDEGWLVSPDFGAETPEEAIQKGLCGFFKEANALSHVYQKIETSEKE